jgi:hypothetical protein
MVKLAIIAAILPAAAWWRTTEFSQAAISEPGRMRVIFPATCHQQVV